MSPLIYSLFPVRWRRLILALAVLLSGMILGILFQPLQFLMTASFIASFAIAFGSYYSPSITLDDEQIVLRDRTNKEFQITRKNKSIGITEIIEWEGYEGKIIDIVWADKDMWSLHDIPGLSGQKIQKSLRQCGFSAIPIKRFYRVFRPQKTK